MPELDGADRAPNPWRADDSPRLNVPSPRAPATDQTIAHFVSGTAQYLTTGGRGQLLGLEQLVDHLGRILDTPIELRLSSTADDLHWTIQHDALGVARSRIVRELHGLRAVLEVGQQPDEPSVTALLEAWLDITLLAVHSAARHRRAERPEIATEPRPMHPLEREELLNRLVAALPSFPAGFIRAVLDDDLTLRHQPISTPDGRISASDVLVYADPNHFALDALDLLDGPDEPLVTSQLTIPLGNRLVSLAIPTLHRLVASGQLTPSHRMHIRMLHRQLANRQTVEQLTDLLSTHDMQPGSLAIDVAEPTLLDHRDTISAMSALADHGVALYLDGFGGAGSNFTLLRTSMLSGVKLSAQIVAGVARDARQASILSGLIGLGVRLGLDIIATGVDDQADLDWLSHVGPIGLQGNLIGVARTEAELLQPHSARAA